MGTILEVQCQQCGTTSHQLDGAIMAGYLPRCVQCGQDTLVRWEDVSGRDSDERDARIEELAGSCACGGTYAMGASIRCSDCRSADVVIADVGIAD